MRKSILLFVLFTLTSIPLLLFAQGGYQVTGHIISAEDRSEEHTSELQSR